MKLLCTVLLTLSFGGWCVETSKKVIAQDKAVLRIEQQVYFASDLERYRQQVTVFQCLAPKSLSSRFLEQGPNWIVTFLRFLPSVLKEKSELDLQELSFIKKNQKCLPGGWSNWPRELHELLVVEAYLIGHKVPAEQVPSFIEQAAKSTALRSYE